MYSRWTALRTRANLVTQSSSCRRATPPILGSLLLLGPFVLHTQAGEADPAYRETAPCPCFSNHEGMMGPLVAVAPTDPRRLYVAGYETFCASTNGGAAWTQTTPPPAPLSGGYPHADEITVAPHDPKAVYWARQGLGVLRSLDGGKSWTNTLPASGPAALASAPDGRLFAAVTEWTESKKEFSSTTFWETKDGAESWRYDGYLPGVAALRALPPGIKGEACMVVSSPVTSTNISYVMRLGPHDEVTRSMRVVDPPLVSKDISATLLRVPTGKASRLLYGGANVVWMSDDDGKTWRPGQKLSPKSQEVVDSIALGKTAVYATSGNTVYKSSDRGDTWSVFVVDPKPTRTVLSRLAVGRASSGRDVLYGASCEQLSCVLWTAEARK